MAISSAKKKQLASFFARSTVQERSMLVCRRYKPDRHGDRRRSRERKEPSGSYRSYGKSRDSFRFNALPTEVVAPHRCHLHDCLLVAGPMWCVSLYNPANEVSFFVQASRVISRRKLSTSCCTGSLALSAQKSTPVWFITLLCCG